MSSPRTLPGLTHHRLDVAGVPLHYVSAGTSGSPVLLVHGFPETWWAFSRLIPLLARRHRVFAVDLRGFGDSGTDAPSFTSADSAADLAALIDHLDLGAVHLVAQDIAGGAAFRLAAGHPELVASFAGVEMGLAGFGLEGFGDVTHGGSWHIGVLAAPGIPELLLTGRERALLSEWAFPTMTAVAGSVTADDIDEFARAYARPGGWRGAAGLYRSMLAEGEELRALAAEHPLRMPLLAVGAFAGPFTAHTLQAVAGGAEVSSVILEGVGHHVALEAPAALADALEQFLAGLER